MSYHDGNALQVFTVSDENFLLSASSDKIEVEIVENHDKKGNFEMTHVIHEIPPVYDDRSKILILGSFPSVKSREGQFFYHHKQNRFWKVLAAVFEDTLPETIEEKKEFLLRHNLPSGM